MNTPLLVMLVEDHDELREATLEVLSQAGMHALGAGCAEELDDLPCPRAPDVYIIDLNLPGEDGLALAARLRQTRPQAGIVITTARTRLDDRIQGYETGADVYLPKPVDPGELLAVLRALGKRCQLAQAGHAALELDTRQLLLRGPAGQCRLAESETRLLSALASARDQSLERWQVAAQLSPGAEDINADSLQNRLSQLRKKLQACGVEGESIKAIRQLGYRLCIPLEVH
jgi:DNA-binding response OmpR family regulator